jgi:hypothetical protein
MNMTANMSAMDLIVGLAILFAAFFFAAWLISPRLRKWVERPKYRFQADIRAYDQVQSEKSTLKGRNTRA